MVPTHLSSFFRHEAGHQPIDDSRTDPDLRKQIGRIFIDRIEDNNKKVQPGNDHINTKKLRNLNQKISDLILYYVIVDTGYAIVTIHSPLGCDSSG